MVFFFFFEAKKKGGKGLSRQLNFAFYSLESLVDAPAQRLRGSLEGRFPERQRRAAMIVAPSSKTENGGGVFE